MKNINISGNVTKDAVSRRTQGGDPVLSFSVAVNDHRTKEALFFDCSLWGVRGDKVASFITKGTKVSVCGDLGRREHEGRTYLTVNVQELTLMGGGEPASAPDSGRKPARREPEDRDSYGNKPANFSRDLGDDIPFAPEWR